MEALFSQLALLADQALQDKDFDPSRIDDVMRLFEVEADNAWSAAEAKLHGAACDAEASMRDAEDLLNSLMDAAMEEFWRTDEGADRAAKDELSRLVVAGKAAGRMGHALGTAASAASKKYVDAAMASAVATMKSARDVLSGSKIHPS